MLSRMGNGYSFIIYRNDEAQPCRLPMDFESCADNIFGICIL